jgi:hypothetical protein
MADFAIYLFSRAICRVSGFAGLGLVFAPTWVFLDELNCDALVSIAIEGLAERSTADIYLLRNPGTPTAAIKAFSESLRQKIAQQLYSNDHEERLAVTGQGAF